MRGPDHLVIEGQRSISLSRRFGDSVHLTGEIVFKELWLWTAARLYY